MPTTRKADPKKAVARKPGSRMTVLIRDKPPTYNWGWFSREDSRMHLQTVDENHRNLHHKVWLEKNGQRVFEPEPGIPAKVLKSLQNELAKQRGRIEAYWVIFMIQRGWLRVRLINGVITLYAYPNLPNHFERVIKLRDVVPNEEVAQTVTPQDVALNKEFGFLELFPKREEAARPHLPLEDILWVG